MDNDRAFDEFSPHIINKRRKNFKVKSKDSNKLSLKNKINPPAPPVRRSIRRTTALSQNNSSTSSCRNLLPVAKPTAPKRCQVHGKENQPCHCHLISSDSDNDELQRQIIAELISEDESRKSTSTYKTCRTSQQPEVDVEIDHLQSSFQTLTLTPDRSVTEEVNSCEKVQLWLRCLSTKDKNTSSNVSSRRRIISETSSDGSDPYPETVSVMSNVSSMHATSRQSSSFIRSTQSTQQSTQQLVQISQQSVRSTQERVFRTQRSSQNTVSQESIQYFQQPTNNREPALSVLTEYSSQATTVDTRSSSHYFKDHPPWSKKAIIKNPGEKILVRASNTSSELSEIQEHGQVIPDTSASTEESFQLHYDTNTERSSTDHSFYSNSLISNDNSPIQSKQVSPVAPGNEDSNNSPNSLISEDNSPIQSKNVSYEYPSPSTVPLQRSGSGTVLSKHFVSRAHGTARPHSASQESPNRSVQGPVSSIVSHPASTSTVPGEYLVSKGHRTTRPHSKAQQEINKSAEEGSVASTILLPSSVSTVPSDYFVNKGRRATRQQSSVSGRRSADDVSVASTVPLPTSSASTVPTEYFITVRRKVQPSPPQESDYTSADEASVASTVPLPSSVSTVPTEYLLPIGRFSTITGYVPQGRKSEDSVASTVLLPNSSLSSVPSELLQPKKKASKNKQITRDSNAGSLSNSQEADDEPLEYLRSMRLLATPTNEKTSTQTSSEIFNWPLLSKNEVKNIISTIQEERHEPVNSVATTVPWLSDCESPLHHNREEHTRISVKSSTVISNSFQQQTVQETRAVLESSVIELSSDSSDSEVESPDKIFRKKPNRASYIEIVVSDSENEDTPVKKSLQKTVIPESDEESDEEDATESQETYFSGSFTYEQNEVDVAKKLEFNDSDVSDKSGDEKSDDGSPEEDQEPVIQQSKPLRQSKSPSTKTNTVVVTPPRRRHNISSDSSDNDDQLEKFFEATRAKREQTLQKHLAEDDSPNFIVPDDEEEEDDSEDGASSAEEGSSSPAFYLRLINDKKKKNVDLDESWRPEKVTPVNTKKTAPTKNRKQEESRTVGRTNPKPQFVGGTMFSPVLSFLASLSAPSHARCHPESIQFIKRFKANRNELSRRLYAMFNQAVFGNKLDTNMPITWNNRLRSTAGFCYNQRKIIQGGEQIRTSRIELSAKILLDPGRLRDTLIHEMCHAATWVISAQLGGHGPIWRQWTIKARRAFPDLPQINRCHSYEIETKYTYQCTQCSYSFGRHTKSVDIERKVCGLCRGKFQVLMNGGTVKDPTPSRPPNAFALFVKEHYKVVKANRKSLKHGDVMKMLSQKFAQNKISQ